MKNADIILGLIKDGEVEVHDLCSTGNFGPRLQDTELGGTSDVSVYGGREDGEYTIIEFQRALTTNDEYDPPINNGINNRIWAYSKIDDLQIKHTIRDYGEIRID